MCQGREKREIIKLLQKKFPTLLEKTYAICYHLHVVKYLFIFCQSNAIKNVRPAHERNAMELTLKDRLNILLDAYSHHYNTARDVETPEGSYPATADF